MGDKAEELRRQPDEEWPPWSGFIRAAWQDLRDDRHMGDMGEMGRIYWAAIDRYAERHEISGNDFDEFLMFVRVLDDEFMRHLSEKRKAEDAAKKANA